MNEDILELFEGLHQALFAAVTGLTDEQFRRRPGGDEWSISEVLAHLAAARRRLRAAFSTDAGDGRPPAPLTDEQRVQEASAGRRLPPPQIIHDLIASHRDIRRAYLEALSPANTPDRQAHGGRAPAVSLLESHVAHEIDHLSQIWAIRSRVGESIPLIHQDRPPDEGPRTLPADNSFTT